MTAIQVLRQLPLSWRKSFREDPVVSSSGQAYCFRLRREAHRHPPRQRPTDRSTRISLVRSLGEAESVPFTPDFFQTDVVEYGSRYSRPDRFPRLRTADKGIRGVDVTQWLTRLCHVAHDLGFQGVKVPECDELVEGEQGKEISQQLLTFSKQGKLEDALRLLERWKGPGFAGQTTQEHERKGHTGPLPLPHTLVVLAAVDGGDVALAFEYAALLPPTADCYALLMAAYAVRGDLGAVLLGLSTAQRRGIRPSAGMLLVAATAAVLVKEWKQAQNFLDEAQNAGFCPHTSTEALAAAVQKL